MPTEPSHSGARRPPQVVVLLDEAARVLSISSSLAGSGFLGLTESERIDIHAQLHPACDGRCQFSDLWKKAWKGLSATECIEWEISDPVLGKMLRLNLTRPPTNKNVVNDRRRRHALLTITDITRYRREYESLIEREQALLKLLRDQGVDPDDSANYKGDTSAMGVAREIAEETQRYRALNRQVLIAEERERKRIASELHDSLAQSAGVIKYTIEAGMEQLSRADPDLDLSALEDVVDQTRALVDEIRRISSNLAPSMVEDFGLCVAVQGLCNEFRSADSSLQPTCGTDIAEADIPDVVRSTVYRVVQEALNNIAKHAAASEVDVDLRIVDGALRLVVQDNGVGFEAVDCGDADRKVISGSGLRNMRERVLATGGEFAIESAPGQGVKLEASWPRASLDLLSDESVLDGVDGNS